MGRIQAPRWRGSPRARARPTHLSEHHGRSRSRVSRGRVRDAVHGSKRQRQARVGRHTDRPLRQGAPERDRRERGAGRLQLRERREGVRPAGRGERVCDGEHSCGRRRGGRRELGRGRPRVRKVAKVEGLRREPVPAAGVGLRGVVPRRAQIGTGVVAGGRLEVHFQRHIARGRSRVCERHLRLAGGVN